MRIRHIALAAFCAASLAGPAFAQTTTAPVARPTAPATMAPAPAMKPMTPAPTAAAPAPAATLTNINTASPAELDALPQIGKARLAAIIKNRPYKTTDELVSKKVLSKGVYDKIKDKITTG